MKQTNSNQRQEFIVELGKALHKFGTPAFRLEANLTRVSQYLGIEGQFAITPTMMTIVLWEPGQTERNNYISRVNPGELDLGALVLADELVDSIISEKMTVSDALSELNSILNRPEPYGTGMTLFAFAMTGAAFAMLIANNMADVVGSTLTSLVVYSILWIVAKTKISQDALEPMVAIASAVSASALAYFYPEINIPVVVLSGIIVFIPGLSITMGLKDMASRHLMSGTARVMDGVMSLFKLYFGAVLGGAIGTLIWGQPEYVASVLLPEWTVLIAVPLLSLTLVIIFKCRMKEALWAVLSGVVAFLGSKLGAAYLGDSLGLFVGALLVGVYSNLFSRITNSPSITVLLPGVVFLVPGSKAYIGLNEVVSGHNMLNVTDIGPQTFLIFMSITAGLIFANTFIPSRKPL